MDGDDQKREFRVPSLNNKSKMASEPGSKVRSGHLTQAGSDLTHLAPPIGDARHTILASFRPIVI